MDTQAVSLDQILIAIQQTKPAGEYPPEVLKIHKTVASRLVHAIFNGIHPPLDPPENADPSITDLIRAKMLIHRWGVEEELKRLGKIREK